MILNLEEFTEKYGISEETLMNMKLKDILRIPEKQKEEEMRKQKRQEEIQSRAQDETYRTYVMKFLENVEYLKKWFSEEEIIRACTAHMGIRDLVQEEFIPGATRELQIQRGIFLREERRKVEEHRGAWSREVYKDGAVFHVRNRYQGVCGAHKVTKELLLSRCPYLKDYDIYVYDVDEGNDWVFVKFGLDSLYTPFSAFMEKDADKIVKTHLDYWRGYNHGKDYEMQNNFIQSKPVQEFLRKVTE